MSDSVQTTQMHVDPSVIDFGVGQPQLSLLPLDRIRAAAELRFARGDPAFLQYGAEQGDGFLRRGLARYLEQAYGFPVSPSELFITNGASQGLDLICTLFTRPGDTILSRNLPTSSPCASSPTTTSTSSRCRWIRMGWSLRRWKNN
jgi:2-aminoadipate transaminase